MKTYFSFGLTAPVILLPVLIVVWGVLTYYYYRRIKASISRPLFIFLLINRIVIFTLLLLCLWQPRIVTEYGEKLKNAYISIVADNSKSMSIPDGSTKANSTRMEDVNELLKAGGTFRKGLEGKIAPERQRFYEFADKTKRISGPDKTMATGPRTNFKEMVKRVSLDAEGLPSAGIVIFSDGNETTGSDLSALAFDLKAKKLPVYAVGIGGGKGFKDLEITSFTGPEEVLERTIISLKALIKYSGEPVKQLPVILKENGKIIETRYQDFNGKNTVTVVFNIASGSFGVKNYSLELPPVKGELFKENNTDSWNVTVKKTPDIKALFISHQLDYDFMYMKGAAKDLKIKYASALLTSPGLYLRQRLAGFDDLKKGFPGSKEELFKYNVLVLCNVDFALFSAEQLSWAADFVKIKKGGLLLFGENINQAKAGALLDILPVVLGSTQFTNPEKGFLMNITPEGKGHEIFGSAGNLDTALTPALRNFENYTEVKGLKAGSIVLSTIADKFVQKKENPFIVAQKAGGGRVLFFAGGDFWKWKMNMDSTSRVYENFWRNVMVWLAVSNVKQEGITIVSDKSKYTEGDTAIFKVECVNAEGTGIKNVRLKGVLETVSGKKENIDFSETGEGDYSARNKLKEAGLIKLTVEGVLAAGTEKETTSILLGVKSGDEEFKNIGLNETALKRLSALSGGEYTSFENLNTLYDKIEKGAETQIKKTVTRDLWDNIWILTLILLLFAAELIIRKWKSLF